jgi:probable F420-dependent oxidoreductase
MALKTLFLLTENWQVYPPRDLPQLLEAAKIAEDTGCDYVAVSEHVVMGPSACFKGPKFNPRQYHMQGNQSPLMPHPNPLILLSAISAVTTRVKLMVCALIPPLHHPLDLAKQLATLDLLTKGRLIVFPTVSWQIEEYRALGVPFDKRGKLLDEHLEIWRKVWAESPASFTGEHYSFNDIYVEPKPWRPEGPDLWITGDKLHAAALRRVVRYGKAFAPLAPVTPHDRATIATAMTEAGRDPKMLDYMGFIIGTHRHPTGTADIDEALKTVAPQVENGVTTFMFKPDQFIEKPDQLRDLCEHVVGFLKTAG